MKKAIAAIAFLHLPVEERHKTPTECTVTWVRTIQEKQPNLGVDNPRKTTQLLSLVPIPFGSLVIVNNLYGTEDVRRAV